MYNEHDSMATLTDVSFLANHDDDHGNGALNIHQSHGAYQSSIRFQHEWWIANGQ